MNQGAGSLAPRSERAHFLLPPSDSVRQQEEEEEEREAGRHAAVRQSCSVE